MAKSKYFKGEKKGKKKKSKNDAETDVSDTVTVESEDIENLKAKKYFTTDELCEKGLLSGRLDVRELPDCVSKKSIHLKNWLGIYILPNLEDPSESPVHPIDFTNFVRHRYSDKIMPISNIVNFPSGHREFERIIQILTEVISVF